MVLPPAHMHQEMGFQMPGAQGLPAERPGGGLGEAGFLPSSCFKQEDGHLHSSHPKTQTFEQKETVSVTSFPEGISQWKNTKTSGVADTWACTFTPKKELKCFLIEIGFRYFSANIIRL